MESLTERFFAWRKTAGISDEQIAETFGHKNSRTFLNWQKEGIPKGKQGTALGLMQLAKEPQDETSLIRVPFSDDLLEKAHQAAAIVSTEFQDFCSRAIQHRAEEIIAGSTRPAGKVYQMPTISGRVAEPDIIKADEPHGRDES